MTNELSELKKKLRAYEVTKNCRDKVKDDPKFSSIERERYDEEWINAYNDLHDFVFQGNITSEDIG